MDGSCLVVLICLGRYYPLAPFGLFIQHWYLFGPPPKCGAPRSFDTAALPDRGFVEWGVPRLQRKSEPVFQGQLRVVHLLERCWWLPSSEWVPCNSLSGKRLYGLEVTVISHRQRQLMMPKNHQWATQSLHACNNTCTIKKKDLTESTGVVLAKYPLKVKLESFRHSRVSELGSIMRTFFLRVFVFL